MVPRYAVRSHGVYLQEVKQTVERIREEYGDFFDKFIDYLLESRLYNKNIFIVGNGGSAATAIHFASDLNKGARHPYAHKAFKARALTENISDLTAIANDKSYEDVFVDQLRNNADYGDTLIAISCSGNSRNVVKAIEFARSKHMTIVGMTGDLSGGGEMRDKCHAICIVPSSNIRICEDVHMIICHAVSYILSKIPDFGIFIDRDGTICPDKHYLSKPEDLEFYPGVRDLKKFNEMGIPIIMITNQSGIGRGYFTENEYRTIESKMLGSLIDKFGVVLEDVYHCPHNPEKERCFCRKPSPQMVKDACEKLKLSPELSYVVGDSDADKDMARLIGCRFFRVNNGDLDVAIKDCIENIERRRRVGF